MRTTIGLVLALAVLTAACGSSDDADGGDAAAPETTAASGVAVFSDDFESVCRGTGVAAAAAYDPAAPGPHPLLVFAGEDPEYSQRFATLPDGWEASYPDLDRAELVVCVDRTSATQVRTCTDYEVDAEGDYRVEVFDASYEVTLYRATDASVVDSTSFDVVSDGCPGFVLFTEGEEVKEWFDPYDDRLEAFLQPHVAG